MIEIKQLCQLVTVAERGTMTAAAKELFLSQPALSRSIQRLEADLGVRLFEHGKNNTHLNQVGLLAVERAKVILSEVDALPGQLRALDQSLRTICIGSCAPMPSALLVSALSKICVDRTISSELTQPEALVEGLVNGRYQLVVLDRPADREGCLSRKYVSEHICLSVPREHPLAKRSFVTFADLAGMTLLGYQNVGRWKLLYDCLPEAHFIIEKEDLVIRELIRSFALPSIVSNLDPFIQELQEERACIPIVDDLAAANYYLCARTAQASLLEKLA